MAITFPRTLPSGFVVVGLQFVLQPLVETAPLRSGGKQAVEIGPSLWKGSFETPPLSEEDFGAMRAALSTLITGEAFYAYDTFRQYPLAYPDGFGAFPGFDGTCDLISVTDSKVATLYNLPNGFELSPGDYIAFDYGTDDTKRALHMIVSGGTASGSPETEVQVELRPEVRAGWEGSPSVRATVFEPSAKMTLDPGSWQVDVGVDRLGTISFEATQTLD